MVDVLAQGAGAAGGAAGIVIIPINLRVMVAEQVVPEIVHMLPVVLVEVTAAACRRGYAGAFGQPGVRGIDIPLIVNHLVDLGGHLVCALRRETAHDDVVVEVVADKLAEPVVGTSAIALVAGIVALDMLAVAHEQDVGDGGVFIVLSLDVALDGFGGGTADGGADHGSGDADLFFPGDEGLHGLHESVMADDEHLAGLVDRSIAVHHVLTVDEAAFI